MAITAARTAELEAGVRKAWTELLRSPEYGADFLSECLEIAGAAPLALDSDGYFAEDEDRGYMEDRMAEVGAKLLEALQAL